MNVLCEIQFATSIERFALQRTEYDSKQWLGGYLVDISNISYGLGDEKEYESIRATATFNDVNGWWREKEDDATDKYIEGSRVILYTDTGNTIATLRIKSYKRINRDQIKVEISDRDGEIDGIFTEKITLEEFPDCVQSAIDDNAVIPIVYGQMAANNKGTIKAYQVMADSYLVNSNDNDTATISYAEDDSGNNITASCSIVYINNRTYVSYNATNPDYIFVNITVGSYKNNDPQDVLKNIIETYAGFTNPNYTTKAALTTFMDNMEYTSQFIGYAITTDKKLTGVRKDFSVSHNMDCITNTDGETEVKWIDLNDLTPVDYFQQGTFSRFERRPDPDYFQNRIYSHANYDHRNSSFIKEFQIDHFTSQSRFGMRTGNIDSKFCKTDEIAVWNAKYKAVFEQYPRERVTAEFLNINDYFDSGVEIGDLIKIDHENAKTTGFRLYQIRKVFIDFAKDKLSMSLYDYDFLSDIDTNVNLLIRGSGSDKYLDHFDYAINTETGNHVLTPVLSIENRNTQVLFYESSVYAWGSRYIRTANASEWDLFNSVALGDDKTISAYIYVNDLSGTYTNAQPIIEHYQDANNRWNLQLESSGSGSTGKLQFLIYSGGATIANIKSTTALSTGTWYHIALVKTTDGTNQKIGIYINGTQEAYFTTTNTYNFAGLLYDFGTQPRTRYLQAYVAEAYIYSGNIFSASPVAGLTDTFTPWWHPFGDEGKKITLAVDNPRDDEQWKRGTIKRIKWNIPNIWVKVELFTNAGVPVFVKTLTASTGNKMYYDWDISAAETIAERRIKVTSLDGNISVFSNLFDIIA